MKTEWASRNAVRVWEWGWGPHKVLTFPGCVVERRGRVHDIVLRVISSEFLHKVQDAVAALPALVRNGWSRDHDWVDRAAVRGLLRLRRRGMNCFVCGKRFRVLWETSDPPRVMASSLGLGREDARAVPCHWECYHRRRAELEAGRSEIQIIRRTQKQTKVLRKIADVMDVPLTFAEAAALLPWRPHKAALVRMVIKGRLDSITVDGERRLRGRDLLPLVKDWVATGRAPWRNSKKAREQLKKELTA